jgi:hypothetical protein
MPHVAQSANGLKQLRQARVSTIPKHLDKHPWRQDRVSPKNARPGQPTAKDNFY